MDTLLCNFTTDFLNQLSLSLDILLCNPPPPRFLEPSDFSNRFSFRQEIGEIGIPLFESFGSLSNYHTATATTVTTATSTLQKQYVFMSKPMICTCVRARACVHFVAVLCKRTTWNDQISSSFKADTHEGLLSRSMLQGHAPGAKPLRLS